MRFRAWWHRPKWGKSLEFSRFFEGHAYRLPRFFCPDAAIEVGSAGAEFGAGFGKRPGGGLQGSVPFMSPSSVLEELIHLLEHLFDALANDFAFFGEGVEFRFCCGCGGLMTG